MDFYEKIKNLIFPTKEQTISTDRDLISSLMEISSNFSDLEKHVTYLIINHTLIFSKPDLCINESYDELNNIDISISYIKENSPYLEHDKVINALGYYVLGLYNRNNITEFTNYQSKIKLINDEEQVQENARRVVNQLYK